MCRPEEKTGGRENQEIKDIFILLLHTSRWKSDLCLPEAVQNIYQYAFARYMKREPVNLATAEWWV